MGSKSSEQTPAVIEQIKNFKIPKMQELGEYDDWLELYESFADLMDDLENAIDDGELDPENKTYTKEIRLVRKAWQRLLNTARNHESQWGTTSNGRSKAEIAQAMLKDLEDRVSLVINTYLQTMPAENQSAVEATVELTSPLSQLETVSNAFKETNQRLESSFKEFETKQTETQTALAEAKTKKLAGLEFFQDSKTAQELNEQLDDLRQVLVDQILHLSSTSGSVDTLVHLGRLKASLTSDQSIIELDAVARRTALTQQIDELVEEIERKQASLKKLEFDVWAKNEEEIRRIVSNLDKIIEVQSNQVAPLFKLFKEKKQTTEAQICEIIIKLKEKGDLSLLSKIETLIKIRETARASINAVEDSEKQRFLFDWLNTIYTGEFGDKQIDLVELIQNAVRKILNEEKYYTRYFPELSKSDSHSLVSELEYFGSNLSTIPISILERRLVDIEGQLESIRNDLVGVLNLLNLVNDNLNIKNVINKIDKKIKEVVNLINKIKVESSELNTDDSLLAPFQRTMDYWDNEDHLPRLDPNEDVIQIEVSHVERELSKLKELLSDQEYKEQLLKFYLWSYRFTKRILDRHLTDDELKHKNRAFYIEGGGWDAFYDSAKGFGRLNMLIQKLENLTDDDTLIRELKADFERFKQDISLRRIVFYAGATLEPTVFGVGDLTQKAQRTIPQQTPEVFPSMDQIAQTILPSTPITEDDRLRFKEERTYNRELPSRTERIMNHRTGEFEERRFTPTVSGDVRRLLDLLYKNQLQARIKHAILSREHREPNEDEKELMREVTNFYKEMHISSKKYTLADLISQASKIVYGYEITEEEVKETWWAHLLFLNQSMLIPHSSPFLNDLIYKANQWLDYLLSGSETGVTGAGLFTSLALFAKAVAGGDWFLVDAIGGYDKKLLPKRRGISVEKIGSLIVQFSLPDKRSGVREGLIKKLEEKDLESQLWVADLPLVSVHSAYLGYKRYPNPLNGAEGVKDYTHPIIPMPLQFMLIGNPHGDRNDPLTKVLRHEYALQPGERLEDYNLPENRGKLPPPAVAVADYINEYGDIMYEAVPWDQILPSTSLGAWYNNGANFAKLFQLITQPPSEKVIDPNSMAGSQNDIKYAMTAFPLLGPEVATGRLDPVKVFNRIMTAYAFGAAIDLIMNGKLSLKDVKDRLIDAKSILEPVSTEDVTPEGVIKPNVNVDGIVTALEFLLSGVENTEELLKRIAEQIRTKLAYQK